MIDQSKILKVVQLVVISMNTNSSSRQGKEVHLRTKSNSFPKKTVYARLYPYPS